MSDKLTPSEPAELAPISASINLQGPIEAAVALGKDGIEVLERLEAMQARQDERTQRAAFNSAIARLHGVIGSIHKNQTAHFKTKSGGSVSYKYADKHATASELRKHIGHLGLAWRWSTVKETETSVTVRCTVMHEAGHSEDVEWTAPIEPGNPMTSGAQKRKIATTFAERVTLQQAFGLTDTEDDVDGQMPADAPRTDDAFLTADQVKEIRAALKKAEKDEGRLCSHLGIDSLGTCPARWFTDTIAMVRGER